MKRTIYSLACLPFIAFSIKTIAEEGNIIATPIFVAEEFSGAPAADMDTTVQQFVSPEDFQTYLTMKPEGKKLVYDAIMNAPPGQEGARATSVITAYRFKQQQAQNQPTPGGQPSAIIFENTPTPSPAAKACAKTSSQSGTPASLADMMQTPQAGTPAANAENGGVQPPPPPPPGSPQPAPGEPPAPPPADEPPAGTSW